MTTNAQAALMASASQGGAWRHAKIVMEDAAQYKQWLDDQDQIEQGKAWKWTSPGELQPSVDISQEVLQHFITTNDERTPVCACGFDPAQTHRSMPSRAEARAEVIEHINMRHSNAAFDDSAHPGQPHEDCCK